MHIGPHAAVLRWCWKLIELEWIEKVVTFLSATHLRHLWMRVSRKRSMSGKSFMRHFRRIFPRRGVYVKFCPLFKDIPRDNWNLPRERPCFTCNCTPGRYANEPARVDAEEIPGNRTDKILLTASPDRSSAVEQWTSFMPREASYETRKIILLISAQ